MWTVANQRNLNLRLFLPIQWNLIAGPPSDGDMKPKPLSSRKNLTTPVFAMRQRLRPVSKPALSGRQTREFDATKYQIITQCENRSRKYKCWQIDLCLSASEACWARWWKWSNLTKSNSVFRRSLSDVRVIHCSHKLWWWPFLNKYLTTEVPNTKTNSEDWCE